MRCVEVTGNFTFCSLLHVNGYVILYHHNCQLYELFFEYFGKEKKMDIRQESIDTNTNANNNATDKSANNVET